MWAHVSQIAKHVVQLEPRQANPYANVVLGGIFIYSAGARLARRADGGYRGVMGPRPPSRGC